MIADIDSFIRRYGKHIETHVGVAFILKNRDLQKHPYAYQNKYF